MWIGTTATLMGIKATRVTRHLRVWLFVLQETKK